MTSDLETGADLTGPSQPHLWIFTYVNKYPIDTMLLAEAD